MIKPNIELIAITTYYNPCKYKSRIENFKIFKQHLSIPLITVELSFDGSFELSDADSDQLIRITGKSVMWQKERLLNIALNHVPSDVKYIAWLDCDIIIENSNWVNLTKELLQKHQMIQLFSRLVDLPKNVISVDDMCALPATGTSISSLWDRKQYTQEDFRPVTSNGMRRVCFGLAWAAKADLIKKHLFYDAMIIGSGDRAMACAGFGHFDDATYVSKMSDIREQHYLKWANPFFVDVRACIGCLDGILYHLWHGDISDRGYVQRHKDFSAFNFDPLKDIYVDSNGCWQWTTANSTLAQYVTNYFKIRNEDGSI